MLRYWITQEYTISRDDIILSVPAFFVGDAVPAPRIEGSTIIPPDPAAYVGDKSPRSALTHQSRFENPTSPHQGDVDFPHPVSPVPSQITRHESRRHRVSTAAIPLLTDRVLPFVVREVMRLLSCIQVLRHGLCAWMVRWLRDRGLDRRILSCVLCVIRACHTPWTSPRHSIPGNHSCCSEESCSVTAQTSYTDQERGNPHADFRIPYFQRHRRIRLATCALILALHGPIAQSEPACYCQGTPSRTGCVRPAQVVHAPEEQNNRRGCACRGRTLGRSTGARFRAGRQQFRCTRPERGAAVDHVPTANMAGM